MISQIINGTIKPLGLKVVRIQDEPNEKPGNRYSLTSDTDKDLTTGTKKALNLLNYTKTSSSTYNAELYDSGYHTIELDGKKFLGQRIPEERLKGVPFDFTDKTVLDIGCNQGGMLREVSNKIKHGYGIDYDYRMINAANFVASYKKLDNLNYYVFDLEKENLDIINNYLPEKVDIVFLLSICMWIDNWKQVITKVTSITDNLLFESNGTTQQQDEQQTELELNFSNVELLQDSSPDDPRQKKRRLYLCRK